MFADMCYGTAKAGPFPRPQQAAETLTLPQRKPRYPPPPVAPKPVA